MTGYKTIAAAILSMTYGVGGIFLGLHDANTGILTALGGLGLLGLGSKAQRILNALKDTSGTGPGQTTKSESGQSGTVVKSVMILVAGSGLLIAASCTPLEKAGVNMQTVVTVEEVTVEGADWLLTVMDQYYTTKCAVGAVSAQKCLAWSVIANSSSKLIYQSKAAIAAYAVDKTPVSAAQMKAIIKELAAMAVKLQIIYQSPDTVEDVAKAITNG